MSGAEPAKVLVIDDEEIVLVAVRKMLEAEGLSVDVSLSGRDALARLVQTQYQAILCDMRMPGIAGNDFYMRVKEEFPEYRDRIIFLTGDLASEATWNFIEQRRLPYLLKPFSMAELRRKLNEVIGETPRHLKKDERRFRRIAIKANASIRERWATRGTENAAVINASKEGLYFLTDRKYHIGAEVLVCFPYTGVNDIEQEGCVVRVQERPDKLYDVAIALGEGARSARSTLLGAREDRRRGQMAPLPETTVELPSAYGTSEEAQKLTELTQKMAQERQEARRLAEELTDLRETYQRVSAQRDRLASQEADYGSQLRELTDARTAMTRVIDDLQGQMEGLQQRLAEGEAMRFQATHDTLTGLWNRGAIFDILKRELARAEREGTSVGVLLADLDHFKSINDTHGHLAGDAVLREAAQRISLSVREYDSTGRYGGEEFLIVLVGCDTASTLSQAERIRASINSEPVKTAEATMPITLSLGAAASGGNTDMESLLRAADAALYRAKRSGRNRVELAAAAELSTG